MARFLLCLLAAVVMAPPALAGGGAAAGAGFAATPAEAPRAARLAVAEPALGRRAVLARYGPFAVLDERTVALVGTTGSDTPARFAALLRDWPGVRAIEFVEAPGTSDDVANFALGRMIRAHGMATVVRAGGSVRSGAVELFLAGAERRIDAGAEFAVHGWLDETGAGAADHPADAPHHRLYLDYYAEMGMTVEQAAAFYAMTNSVPFEEALWLTGAEMQRWLRPDAAPRGDAAPRLSYLDLGSALQ